MRKKIIAIMVITLLIIALVVILCKTRHIEPNFYAEVAEMIYRIEDALEKTDENWERQSITVVTPYTYADAEGNTIVYYCCRTAYSGEGFNEIIGLNLDVLSQVVDFENSKNKRECEVNGKTALLCESDGRANLCWTIDSECSCVIEYDPNSVSETDIIKMAESVQAVLPEE